MISGTVLNYDIGSLVPIANCSYGKYTNEISNPLPLQPGYQGCDSST